jgi:hypothetical protein
MMKNSFDSSWTDLIKLWYPVLDKNSTFNCNLKLEDIDNAPIQYLWGNYVLDLVELIMNMLIVGLLIFLLLYLFHMMSDYFINLACVEMKWI